MTNYRFCADSASVVQNLPREVWLKTGIRG
jgi:hypothetical protein